MRHISDFLNELKTEATAAHEARKTGRPGGPVTGLSLVDRELGGWFQPGLHFVLGEPGAGKSAFALQAASNCRAPALYISAEQSPVELFRRLIARQSNTFLGRLKSGELEPADVEQLGRATGEDLGGFYLVDGSSSPATPSDIRAGVEALFEKYEVKPLVVIDSLQAWKRSIGRTLGAVSDYDLTEMALDTLSQLAAECRAALLIVSHRNRSSNRASDGGGLFGAKGSGSIEYVSETILGLELTDGSQPDSKGEVGVELKILKNRHNYAGGSIPLRFSGRLQAFREI